ncbi:MAG: heat-shock protein, partial [Rhodobacterales bacterium]|nr:heat-shock protein [Rhodobacterales bacterium]MDX5413071.1 heat-shock protein [Rhodobacterales bacterium]
ADGMLHIDLVRELPEVLKPRRIQIASAASAAASDKDVVEAKAVN